MLTLWFCSSSIAWDGQTTELRPLTFIDPLPRQSALNFMCEKGTGHCSEHVLHSQIYLNASESHPAVPFTKKLHLSGRSQVLQRWTRSSLANVTAIASPSAVQQRQSAGAPPLCVTPSQSLWFAAGARNSTRIRPRGSSARTRGVWKSACASWSLPRRCHENKCWQTPGLWTQNQQASDKLYTRSQASSWVCPSHYHTFFCCFFLRSSCCSLQHDTESRWAQQPFRRHLLLQQHTWKDLNNQKFSFPPGSGWSKCPWGDPFFIWVWYNTDRITDTDYFQLKKKTKLNDHW